MTDIHKKAIIGVSGAILVILFVVGVMIFMGGMKDEFHRNSMQSDYFEVDRALNLKNMCDQNRDGEACLATARYYLEGRHVEEDRKKAAHYLARSCGFNNGEGCFHLGTFWFQEGESRGSSNNKRAERHFNKSCDLGNSEGCKMLEKMESL